MEKNELKEVYRKIYDEVIDNMTLDMCFFCDRFENLIEDKFKKYDDALSKALLKVRDEEAEEIGLKSLIKFEEDIKKKFEKELKIDIPVFNSIEEDF
jgi:hypothetical protein